MSLEEIVARLAELGESPSDNGVVTLIVRRPEVEQREVLEEADLDTETGLIGDNWLERAIEKAEGGEVSKDAQIAIMNSRILAAISPESENWQWAGDQLIVDLDLSAQNLPIGQRVQIGETILEVSPLPHNGCGKFSARFGSGATQLVNSKEGRENRRRGVNLRIIQGGKIRQGDTVKKLG